MPALSESTRELARKVIGDKTLFGVRLGPKKVRLFVANRHESVPYLDEVEEVTLIVARVTGRKRAKDGSILTGNYGYCPVSGIAGEYGLAMGESDNPGYEHPHRRL